MNCSDGSTNPLERLDRQVHAMGSSAAAKLLVSSFLVVGLDTTGCEIARNILLGGCSRLTICDDQLVNVDDAESNFFVSEKDVGLSRTDVLSERLSQLNPHVVVEVVSETTLAQTIRAKVLLTSSSLSSPVEDIADVVIIVNGLHRGIVTPSSSSRALLLDCMDAWQDRPGGTNTTRFITVRCLHLVAAFWNNFGEGFKFVSDASCEDTSLVPVRVSSVICRSESTSSAADRGALADLDAVFDITVAVDNSSAACLEAIETCMALKLKCVMQPSISGDVTEDLASSVFIIVAVAKVQSNTAAATSPPKGGGAGGGQQSLTSSCTFTVRRHHSDTCVFSSTLLLQEHHHHLFISPFSLPKISSCIHSARRVAWFEPWSRAQPQTQFVGSDADGLALQLLDAAFCSSLDHHTLKCSPVAWPLVRTRCEDLLANGGFVDPAARLLISSFSHHGWRTFLPVSSMVAGLVAQEAMKAVTHQHTPTVGVWSMDCRWMPLNPCPAEVPERSQTSRSTTTPHQVNEDGIAPPKPPPSNILAALFGDDGYDILSNANMFLVGAGAIGCEYLKHFAVMRLATGKRGRLDVTDPDHIEVSNLSRQFLFQSQDVKKSKSAVAVTKARRRCPTLKARSFSKAVSPGSCCSWAPAPASTDAATTTSLVGTFNANFLASFDAIVGAVDNNDARILLDEISSRCGVPMLDSGTLGLQGHVVAVVPSLTSRLSDSASPDPSSTRGGGGPSIPFCTLHFFPSNFHHCIQWAMNAFHELMSDPLWPALPVVARQDGIAAPDELDMAQVLDVASSLANAKERIRYLSKLCERIRLHQDCSDSGPHVALARFLTQRFHQMFVRPVEELLQQHPINDVASGERSKFWADKPQSSPPQVPSAADLKAFVLAAAPLLFTRIFPEMPPTAADFAVGQMGSEWEALQAQIATQSSTSMDGCYRSTENNNSEDDSLVVVEELIRTLQTRKRLPTSHEWSPSATTAVIPFEKDESTGKHVALLAVCANVRARSYAIPTGSPLEVKRIAGRIVPAFISTTSAVTSFAVMQLVTLLLLRGASTRGASFTTTAEGPKATPAAQMVPLRAHLRDLNLSLSDLSLSFLMEVSRHRERTVGHFAVSSWTRWCVNVPKDVTIGELILHMEHTYRIKVTQIVDVVSSQLIYDHVTDHVSCEAPQKEGTTVSRCEFRVYAFLVEIWAAAAAKHVYSNRPTTAVIAPPLPRGAELRIRGFPLGLQEAAASMTLNAPLEVHLPMVVYHLGRR